MKRSIINLIASLLLLGLGWLVPHSVFQVSLETAPTATLIPSLEITPVISADEPTAIPTTTVYVPAPTATPEPVRDPYGELYFTLLDFSQNIRLVRLPGSCVVGLLDCPALETVQTPFSMKDVYMVDGGGLIWSPDGRYALLVTHPEDELSTGKTKEELEKIAKQSPSEFQVNPSTLYLYDAELNTWQVVYRAERKFFYTPTWSPDGQWIAFQVLTSQWAFHASQEDDGIYLVRPDGSEAHQISTGNASIHGWIGNSLLLRQVNGLYPALDYTIEMLSLSGEIKPLFSSSRMAGYVLSPNGSTLLAGDMQGENSGAPIKAVDVLALDGSVIQTFGAFSNATTSIFPLAWSKDGAQIAFANARRVYIGERLAQPASSSDLSGFPADGSVREVYVADDTYVQPSIWKLQFSHDNKYLLMDVYDGMPKLVIVALETNQAFEPTWPGMSSDEQGTAYSWRP